jgi:hypothetical protein
MKVKQTETALVRACLELLSLRKIFAWRNNTTGVFDPSRMKFRRFTGLKGVSDILGILPGGRLLAVECKMNGNVLTNSQDAFIREVNARGGLALCVYNVGDLDELLKRWAKLEGGTRDDT